MDNLKRARIMILIVALGLFFSGITVWPMKWELKTFVEIVWGNNEPKNIIHSFMLQVINGIDAVEILYPFMLYGYDWLAYAHIMLAVLFAGAIRDPVRNKWIVQCGLVMCAIIPVLAGIFIPLRGLPLYWIFIDSAFAPGAALPLWIALRDILKVEKC